MTDLNKLREEFEQLPQIEPHLANGDIFWNHEMQIYESYSHPLLVIAFYANGAWYAYQKQQAKFDLYMNDFTIAANCVKSQQKTIDALKAQLDKLESGDYVLVPKEPTSEMLYCGYAVADNLAKKYSAMVAAAQEQSAEPLNNQMINQLLPVECIRDEMGCWIHPEYSKYIVEKLGSPERISKQEYDALCNHFNIQTVIFYMESCVSADDWEEMMDDCDITKWDPIAPHGFFLINIGFSEDDAYAVYAREIRKYSEVA